MRGRRLTTATKPVNPPEQLWREHKNGRKRDWVGEGREEGVREGMGEGGWTGRREGGGELFQNHGTASSEMRRWYAVVFAGCPDLGWRS